MATGAAWLNRKKIMARTANPKVCLDIDRPSHRRTCAHSKKVRGKSPRRYNSCVRQPMRHVMALRVSKAVLVFAIALFYTILVLNNITDYGSNYEFVRHVLMMDSTFPGNHDMWRAVNSPLVHTVFYIGIIAWESVTMLGRKSLHWCLAGLRFRWFDPIAESPELSDHSCGALLLGLFGDGWTPFFVPDSLVQDQPD